MINLKELSLGELEALQEQIQTQKQEKLERQKEDLKARILRMCQGEGFAIEDLFPIRKTRNTNGGANPTQRKANTSKSSIPAKYENPENPFQTWSGRGHRPKWFKDALLKGKKEKDLLIKH